MELHMRTGGQCYCSGMWLAGSVRCVIVQIRQMIACQTRGGLGSDSKNGLLRAVLLFAP